MIRILLFVCTVLLIGVLSVVALTERDTRADFTYVNPSGIHTLDPARMSWTQDFRVALNIWEGLTTWHPQTTEPIEGAAYFPPNISDDRLTYTFTIRGDARWSNGDPVTSLDFIRGWRRGMEPGTAADYTFLFTDNIAGAAEYVTWRRDVVGVLSALRLLGDGVSIDAKQARSLGRGSVPRRIRSVTSGSTPDPPAGDADSEWTRWAERLSELPVNWSGVADEILAEHAADLDTRFERVGLEAPDERTLIVQLVRRCPYFLDLAGFPTFLPCHESIELLRERHRDAPITGEGLVVYDPQWTKPDYHRNGYPGLITNGPYRLADWIFKRRARLTVNLHHRYAGEMRCRTVDMLEYENVSASLMAYEAGSVDFLTDMNVPYSHELARLSRTGERPDFHRCAVLATCFLNFNCVSESVDGRPNPFVDARVRRAFSLAVDKAGIVEKVLGRGDRVAASFVPPGVIPGYDPPEGLQQDTDEAKRLLAEAGYPSGVGLGTVDVLHTARETRLMEALARAWEETLGVRVELRSLESKTFAANKAKHRFMIARGNWYADYNDPTTFLDCLTTGNGNNDSGYSNAEYDNLLATANRAGDAATRAGLLRRAEAIIVERDLPIVPILHYVELIAIKPHVSGLYPNARLWFPFRYVDVNR